MRTLVDGTTSDWAGFDDFVEQQERFPGSVTITRTSEADYKVRQLIVSIDGEEAATLLWGDSVTRELDPGRHRIRVHNTLVWKNVDFTLGVGEQIFFEAVNRAGPGTLPMTLLFGLGPLYVSVHRM